jgi:hypothetical protein
MEGKVLLETPNFRSPPEIILNGWMDALIHLHDYVEVFRISGPLTDLFEANVSALARLLPQFDDEKHRLSKYSNLTPWRARLRFSNSKADAPPLSIRYRTTATQFSDYRIEDLGQFGPGGDSFFENKVLRHSGDRTDILISSSSMFDIEIHAPGDAVRLELDSHPYGIWSSASDHPGRPIHIAPADGSASNEARFRFSPSQLLMTGQPTDFAKGYNFYHTYHVVALFELSRMTHDIEAAQIILTFARKWLDYIRSPPTHYNRQRRVFADPEKVFRQVTSNRGRRSRGTFSELVQLSQRT